MQFIGGHYLTTVGLAVLVVIGLTAVCLLFKDYDSAGMSAGGLTDAAQSADAALPEKPNVLFALAPLVPVVILILASVFAPQAKISVATAMILGTVYAIAITRSSPQEVVKRFFDGMAIFSESSSPPVCLRPG